MSWSRLIGKITLPSCRQTAHSLHRFVQALKRLGTYCTDICAASEPRRHLKHPSKTVTWSWECGHGGARRGHAILYYIALRCSTLHA
jgi:hypothetical protein